MPGLVRRCDQTRTVTAASPPAEVCDGLLWESRGYWWLAAAAWWALLRSEAPLQQFTGGTHTAKLGGNFVSRLQRKNSDEFLVWLAAFLHDPLELRALLEFAEVFSFERISQAVLVTLAIAITLRECEAVFLHSPAVLVLLPMEIGDKTKRRVMVGPSLEEPRCLRERQHHLAQVLAFDEQVLVLS